MVFAGFYFGASGSLFAHLIGFLGPEDFNLTLTLLLTLTVVVGGLGSMPGALLGGVLIGVSEALAGLFIAPSAKSMFSFALLIIVLLLRPQGLLGKRV